MKQLSSIVVIILVIGAGPLPAPAINWSSPQNLSHSMDKFDNGTGFDVDADGYLHAVWVQWPYEGNHDLMYATNRGGSWTTTRITGDCNGNPCLLVTQQDQMVHIFYRSYGSGGGGGRMYTRTRPVDGGSWSGVTEFGHADLCHFTWAARNANDDIFALYIKLFDSSQPVRNGLYGVLLPAGGSWGDYEIVQSSSDDGNWPMNSWVAAHGNDFYVTYKINNGVNYRIRSNDGSYTTREYLQEDALTLRFDWSPIDDTMAASWFKHDGRCDLDFRVHVQFSTDNGASWSSDNVVSSGCWISRSQEMTYDSEGNLHVVWQRKDDDWDNWDMWYAGMFDDTWSYDINVTDAYPSGDSCGFDAIQDINGELYFFCNISTVEESKGDIHYLTTDINAVPTHTNTPTVTITCTPTNTNTPRNYTPPAGSTSTPTPTTDTSMPTSTPTTASVSLDASLAIW